MKRKWLNPFKLLETVTFRGLRRTDHEPASPGAHAAHSFHYVLGPWGTHEARDYGDALNPKRKLSKAALYFQGKAHAGQTYYGYRIREVFYGPLPYVVKDGRVRHWHEMGPGWEALREQHQDHLHVALSA